jgi:hypothetical protein
MNALLRYGGLIFALLIPVAALAQEAGDLTGDGRVDAQDLTVLEQYLSGDGLLAEEQTRLADLTGDGRIDRRDVEVLRRRLGLAAAPDAPALSGGVRDERRRQPLRATTDRSTFQLGLEEVIPEWVRGNWNFRSTILDVRGASFGASGPPLDESITLPGDLSRLYATYKVSTGERLERVCWQVESHSEERFQFQERLRDSHGAIFASTYDILNRGLGIAEIRIRTDVLDPGAAGGGGGFIGGLLGGLFGLRPGSGLQAGDSYTRGGTMVRLPGSERQRLPQVDLESLRCR